MLLKDLYGKKIVIWGCGSEGLSVLRFLQKRNIACDICIYNDTPLTIPDEKCRQYPVKSGDDLKTLLQSAEIVIRSPGVSIYRPEIIKAKADGVRFTSSTDLCFNELRTNHPDCKIIAITGSKGKSTSVSALHHMMICQGLKTGLGGNIGKPLIDLLDDDNDYVVAEVSSYQAADLSVSPQIAMFTNLFFVHTGWHLTHDNYCRDKLHLIAFQNQDDICFINSRNAELKRFLPEVCKKNIHYYDVEGGFHAEGKLLFYQENQLLDIKKLKLCGDHNLDNLAGVFSIMQYLGLDIRQAAKDMEKFEPLAHRLQKVAVINGVTFINDSISTAPEAAIGAMKSFDGNIAVISGGQENGQDYTDYARFINEHPRVKMVVTLFQCGPQIADAVRRESERDDLTLLETDSLENAVKAAYECLKSCGGGTLLFSPTSPSFGFYKNFMERGQHFIDIVHKLGYK